MQAVCIGAIQVVVMLMSFEAQVTRLVFKHAKLIKYTYAMHNSFKRRLVDLSCACTQHTHTCSGKCHDARCKQVTCELDYPSHNGTMDSAFNS